MNKETLHSYNTRLNTNNTSLDDILNVINVLPEINATEIIITPTNEKQVIEPETPYNAFNKVIVEASSGADLNEYFDMVVTSENVLNFGSGRMLKKMPPLQIQTDNLSNMFNSYKGSYLPLIDATGVTNMQYFCRYASEITDINLINTSQVTNFDSAFQGCSKLVNVSTIDCTSATNMLQMFGNDTLIEELNFINTSNVTNFVNAFNGCQKLKTINGLDTSGATNLNSTFNNCYVLTTINGNLNTSNVENMNNLFSNARALTKIPKLDCSKVTVISNVLAGTHNDLTYLGGFENLGQAYSTTTSASNSNYTLTLNACYELTHESLMNIINNLYDIASKGCKTQRLTLGTTLKNKLTAEEIAIATNKGWTVS